MTGPLLMLLAAVLLNVTAYANDIRDMLRTRREEADQGIADHRAGVR